MAKNTSNSGNKPRSKARFVWVELDSSDEIIEATLKAIISGAAGRPTVLLSAPARQQGSLPVSASDDVTQTPVDAEYEISEPEDNNPDGQNGAEPRKPPRPRVATQPTHIPFDFASGDMPLKTFLEQKNPPTSVAKYSSIAAWLKQYRQLEEIGIDHIYSAYLEAGYPTSNVKDWTRVFYNSRSTRGGGWFRTDNPGLWRLTVIGEGRVREGKFGPDKK